jgi:hypothetical protein
MCACWEASCVCWLVVRVESLCMMWDGVGMSAFGACGSGKMVGHRLCAGGSCITVCVACVVCAAVCGAYGLVRVRDWSCCLACGWTWWADQMVSACVGQDVRRHVVVYWGRVCGCWEESCVCWLVVRVESLCMMWGGVGMSAFGACGSGKMVGHRWWC